MSKDLTLGCLFIGKLQQARCKNRSCENSNTTHLCQGDDKNCNTTSGALEIRSFKSTTDSPSIQINRSQL